MQPYRILIIEEQCDTDGNELEPKVLFGPELIFANTKKGVIKKAVILSKIPAKKIESVNFYINEFSYVSNYGKDD